jgi:Leu/Phe-tRNA-protein transferase
MNKFSTELSLFASTIFLLNLTEEIQDLKSKVLDLQCRSMKNNLVFTGLCQAQFVNYENRLRSFMRQQLNIDHFTEFGNVHRFGRREKIMHDL